MKVTRVDQVTTWQRVKRAALRTVGFKPIEGKEIDDGWKARMLLSEHSPIRLLEFDVSVEDIKQWISVHLVRHWLGFIPFVHSQRDDRRKLDCSRDELPQGSLNDMDFSANAQALINISRKRLCNCAHVETREAWRQVRDAIAEKDPVMASKMVRECVYRGFCSESNCCGYVKTQVFRLERENYMKELPEQNKP